MEKLDYRLPKTKVGERSFKKIIRAGKSLFAKDGFQSTSINDIIAKSKVAAGTFYIYFDNKLALYMYLLDEYRVNIRKAAAEAIKECKTRLEAERAGLKAFILYVRKDPLAYKIIWESMFVDQRIFQEYYTSFAASYVHHLKKSVGNKEVRSDIDLETVAYILMGISNFVGLQIIFKENSDEVDIDFVVDESIKLLQYGMFCHPDCPETIEKK
ncbi:MAG: TetR/AcrR family transcriptional regulator [Bacilli bacterium]|nr:TetR/AcrR family transcriptional regulator [Bacilli bacterium]MBN2877668.1 TetR/AcrR family transcriptional regulator [Bacilli bacterium]